MMTHYLLPPTSVAKGTESVLSVYVCPGGFFNFRMSTQYMHTSTNQRQECESCINTGAHPFMKYLCFAPYHSLYCHCSPRPPLPMSLLWSEEEASLIIQSFWRGYKVGINGFNITLHCQTNCCRMFK